MSRISLREAYDNKDVIAWLVRHQDAIEELQNILKNVTPGGDLTNVVTKTGNQVIDGEKTFIGKIIADCDIIQNGSAYETHAEQIYTRDDYIVTRDGALGGLQPGEYSGFRINKYDAVHDGHLVMDASGTARVGDVGDEQPLATRDEVSDMTSGALVKWDGVNNKIIAPNSNIGSDSKPVKIVNGVPIPVSNDLLQNATTETKSFIGNFVSGVYGQAMLSKISANKGILTINATIDAVLGTIPNTDTIPASSYLSSLGINAITSVTLGSWIVHDNYSPYALKGALMGYSPEAICDHGDIRFGRIYNTSGDWGGWNLQNLTGLVQTSFVVEFN